MATHIETAIIAAPPFTATKASVPPLQSGDRLTRYEFNRRWEASPQIKHAELIFGVVYIHGPIAAWHGDAQAQIIAPLGLFAAATPGTVGGCRATLLLSDDSQPEPDIHLRIAPSHGGQSRLDSGGFIENAPELVVEIAASCASYDLHDKRELYRQHGVREYIVWRAYDNELDWFVLREGVYEQLTPGADGVLRSKFFPGLWLNRAALLSGKMAEVIQQLQLGLATPEHAEFVARLARAAQSP